MNFFLRIISAASLLVCINQNVSAQSWDAQNSGSNITTFNDVFFVSETTGWAVGTSGQILHTTDGGTTWANQFADVVVASALNGVCFTSETDGWIVGNNGVLLHTTMLDLIGL
ncbi:MAG: hypothetical protein IT221_07780 [Fluviicola sp.]|nr:hypothetical protein [Fluviicola sp.]